MCHCFLSLPEALLATHRTHTDGQMLLRDWVSFSPEMPSSNECVETERVSNNVEARAMASKRSELGFAMLVFGLFAVARDSVSYFCS